MRLRAWQIGGLAVGLGAALAGPAQAQAAVYRCPGPPVEYTDALTAQQARDRGCRSIEFLAWGTAGTWHDGHLP